MKVQILRAGVYLDEALRRKACQAGIVLETKEGYGRSLIQDGLAKEVLEEAPKPKKGGKKGKAVRQPAGKKTGAPGNPFLI
jgi:hypothetical protein